MESLPLMTGPSPMAEQTALSLFATDDEATLTDGSDASSYGSPGRTRMDWMDRQASADESFEVVRTRSSVGNGDERVHILPESEATVLDPSAHGTVAPLTRRLRCLFSTITWPIVPLGSIVSIALLWVLYAAFVQDLRRSCSHPLHWYAVASLVLVSYAPHHNQIRSYLFRYSRERDGPVRPRPVRMFDQLFHTICLLYVYGGVTLLQTCRDDTDGNPSSVALKNEFDDASSSEDGAADNAVSNLSNNTCAATCPHLYQALGVYVTTLEMFTFALILPLLFLPCIYLWILRRATADLDAFAQLQERLEEEEALLSGEGVTVQEMMDSLEPVQLVSRKKPRDDGSKQTSAELLLLPATSTVDLALNAEDGSNVKECCICMTEFEVYDEDDIERGRFSSRDSLNVTPMSSHAEEQKAERTPHLLDGAISDDLGVNNGDFRMVRTKCGHVFHRHCLGGWIGGRWESSQQQIADEDTEEERRRRRARRTCCPLCREDLKPQTAYTG